MTATLTGSRIREEYARDPKDASQYVSFWVDGQLVGVPVHTVQEVLNPQTIAPTPLAPPEIAGLLNLRGQIVTAVDLRRRLGLPVRSSGEPSLNVVVRHQGEAFSLLVDQIGDVIDITDLNFEPTPRTVDGEWQACSTGVFALEDRLLVILDVSALLTFA